MHSVYIVQLVIEHYKRVKSEQKPSILWKEESMFVYYHDFDKARDKFYELHTEYSEKKFDLDTRANVAISFWGSKEGENIFSVREPYDDFIFWGE